jgi:hypothetical protein
LLFGLLLELSFIGLFVVGLLFRAKDVGDELIADLFRIGLALEKAFLVGFNDLIVQ